MNSDNEIKNVINHIELGVVKSFVEEIREEEISLDNDLLLSYLPCIFKFAEQVDLIKAIGIKAFAEDRDKCLAINDFCALIKDMTEKGDVILHSQ